MRIDGDFIPSIPAKGELQCIVGYSIQNGACINVIFFTFDPAQEHGVHPGEWMRKAAKAEFAGAFKRWEPEVQAMLDVSGVDVCSTTLDVDETRVIDELKRG